MPLRSAALTTALPLSHTALLWQGLPLCKAGADSKGNHLIDFTDALQGGAPRTRRKLWPALCPPTIPGDNGVIVLDRFMHKKLIPKGAVIA